jgi:chromosome segregation ATPase
MENILRFITPKADTSFLEEDMTIRQALEKMDYYKFSVIPLVDKNGIYKGTVSEGDLLRFIKNDENFNLKTAENVRLFCVPRYRPYSNLSINSKLNEFLIDDGNKELNFKNQILELTKELSDIKSKFKIKSDELTKLNVNNENINKENENLSFYITCKLNDLNDLFDKIKISPKDVIKYQKDINKINNKNDIKYEIIEDALNKVKNNIFNLLTDFNSKLEKLENTISELEKQREIKDMDFNSLETESSNLKYQNIDLGKKYEELIKNYQTLNQSHLRLKQLYSEICHDYEILYNQNGKMIDDINAFYERLNGYFISCGINCDSSRLCQGKTVLQNVILFIQKYNKKEEEIKNANQIIFELNNKLEEHKNSTLIQIKELTNIIDDSKNIIKAYENENENLKIEFEKLNYQYKMLQNKQIENEDNNELNDSNHKNQIN